MARYEKGHKADTHRKVVEIAARRFRAEGVDGVGVASLMADAGLTHGGFYAHFASKEALVKEALIAAVASSSAYEAGEKEPLDLRAFIEGYLSPLHRDRPATGCAMATLGAETARRPRPTRNAFSKEAQRLVARIASGFPDQASGGDRLAAAYGLFAHLIGTLQLSRVVTDKAFSDEILARGRGEVLRLAGLDAEEVGAKQAKREGRKH